jgi:succinate dehydrogenase/fumarate reductase-like Fe-S protein
MKNDVYTYLSVTSPNEVKRIINQYGGQLSPRKDLDTNFREFFIASPQKEAILSEMREIHPDRMLFENDINYGACGTCMLRSSGNDDVSTKKEDTVDNSLKFELESLKNKDQANQLVTQKLLMIGVVGVIAFLLIKNK